MLKADVILPVRNGERYLSSAIASLVPDAKYINKLIIVNDGSTDNTASLLSSLNWTGKLQIIHQETLGVVASLNNALKSAETALVARMDADDVSLPGRLKTQIEYLQSAPNVAAVGSQVLMIDSDGMPTGDKSFYPLDSNDISEQLHENGRCVVAHPTVVMRKDAVLACGGYRAAFQHAEDFDLWLRLSERHRIVNLEEVFLYYRVHRDQVSSQFRARQSFSRDLALYAARERARSMKDPCDAFSGIPNFKDLMNRTGGHGATIQNLAIAYDAIDAVLGKRRTSLTVAAAHVIPALARMRYLGETRRGRYGLLKKAAWTALTRLNFQTAFKAYSALLQCRLADSKTVQSLARAFGTTG